MTERVRQLISERTREALRSAKARGVKLGNPRPSRDTKRLTPLAVASLKKKADAFADSIFPRVWVLFREGWTLAAIANEFNKRRIRTARGGRWHAATIRNVLIREKVSLEAFVGPRHLKSFIGAPTTMPFSRIEELGILARIEAAGFIPPGLAEYWRVRQKESLKTMT